MRTIVLSITAVCSNTTSQDVQADTRPLGKGVRWTNVVGVDRTNVPTTLEIGFKVGNTFLIANASTPGAAARAVGLPNPVAMPEEYVPCARFLGATLADVLELYAFGETIGD